MRLNRLFDFYHPLLTAKQKEYMILYYFEDYSLAEIAQFAHVSRQAVYDNLKRTEQVLESYEKKLQLYEKFKQRTKLLKDLNESVTNKSKNDQSLILIEQLRELS